jgi:hypothetical protein
MIHEDTYPGTGLPVFRVYDAEEYQDTTVRHPRPVGEIWGIGVRGVTGRFVPTGVRWQITGSSESALIPVAGAYARAAQAMIAEMGR